MDGIALDLKNYNDDVESVTEIDENSEYEKIDVTEMRNYLLSFLCQIHIIKIK